ncbi:MAG: peptide chain release factor 1 [Lentisphaerae bacterium GWF2_45_14]|nr:MAG: peptide chain release factor 1 [Lentisphaerae bacterium GWF2_45_14]
MSSYIDSLRSRFTELEARLSDPSIYSHPLESKKVSREHQQLSSLFSLFENWKNAINELASNTAMLNDESDPDMRELIASDIQELEKRIPALEKEISLRLIPPDPNDARNIIVEIRAAAGGEESSLFAGDLYRMYTRYADQCGWKHETLDSAESDLGGIREVIFSLAGDNVYSKMKYESGVHRVQRVPSTESGGRIHTSTITVAVMAEAEDVEIDIRTEDLRFDVFRSSGPGGQCVNTTDSAVRVTHIPSGLSVASQQEKSQHRNREIAMRILRARLLELKQKEEDDKQAASRKAQVGTGERSERIRTYNFPQNRVTDHRFGVNFYDLPKLLDGYLGPLLDQIIQIDCERKLESLSIGTK